jgi:prevent-host-death family protein
MQKGYTVLKDLMRAQGRVIVTVHGSPEAVVLPYQDLKLLWRFVNDLMDRAEDNSFAALAVDRLGNQREERIPLEQGLTEMREMIRGSHE